MRRFPALRRFLAAITAAILAETEFLLFCFFLSFLLCFFSTESSPFAIATATATATAAAAMKEFC